MAKKSKKKKMGKKSPKLIYKNSIEYNIKTIYIFYLRLVLCDMW